jgi:small subunit ribosomal protein S1
MSWTKKNVHPGKIVSTSQEVEVMVLDVDANKRRISLGLKQTQDNPWDTFAAEHPVGSDLTGEVKNATEFGLFIGLPGEIDGMVHLTDLSWSEAGEEAIKHFKKGEEIKVRVLEIDIEKERIGLGVKQLTSDPHEDAMAGLKRNSVVTCTVAQVTEGGLEVTVGGVVQGFIRRAELSRDRSEQRPDRFAVGEKVDAKITAIDRAARRLTLSIKAKEEEEEKQAMADYGSSDSGASLGEILGAALARKAKKGGSSADDGEG